VKDIDLGHGVRLHLQDPDCPLIEFIASTGKRVAFNLRALPHQSGRFAEATINDWLNDQSKPKKKERP
jgi:hypothetical protein